MPWSLQKSGRGYYVVTKGTGRKHSKRPLSLKRAKAQMRALYANERRMSQGLPRYKKPSKLQSRYS
jgi:hypothetical protein